jgi:hypothetical protein
VEVILRTPRRAFFVETLTAPAAIAPPFAGAPFPCLIWDALGGASPEDRFALVDSLIRGGCRYVVCGGADARVWETAADEAFVLRYLDEPPGVADAAHVMTTAHAGEPEDEVVWWLANGTNFDSHDFGRLLVLQLGADREVGLRLRAAVRRHGREAPAR